MKYKIKEVDETSAFHIPKIMKKVYGMSFSQSYLYDEFEIRNLIKENLATFFVALDEHEEVLALLGMQYCSSYRTAAEFCPFVSDPKVRGIESGYLIKTLVNAFYKKIAHSLALNYPKVIYALATTDHPLVIEFCKFLNFTLTGSYHGWTAVGSCIPDISHLQMASEHTIDKNIVFTERRADFLYVRVMSGSIQNYQVTLPNQYTDLLGKIYRKLKLPVTFINKEIVDRNTLIHLERSTAQKRSTIEIDELGPSAVTTIKSYLTDEITNGIEVIHIILPLTQGDTSQIVDEMLNLGFRFCGLLPFYKNRDVLILQYINCSLKAIPSAFIKMASAAEIELYTDRIIHDQVNLPTDINLNDQEDLICTTK